VQRYRKKLKTCIVLGEKLFTKAHITQKTNISIGILKLNITFAPDFASRAAILAHQPA
jgi:hypothetical protein